MQVDPAIVGRVLGNLTAIVGLWIVAGLLGIGIGGFHRWYTRVRVAEGLAVLVGLSGVVLYLNADTSLGLIISNDPSAPGLLSVSTIVVNSVTLAGSVATAAAGGRLGDRLGESAHHLGGRDAVDVSSIVRSVGRVITVDLPDDVADMAGYDPVEPAVKESLSGKTFVFPRRLTVEELRERLVARLKSDYGVGYVDVDVTDDGTVEYLALGSRESGIGPTLPPETCAVAVHADPAFAASAGDVVQVYRPGPDDHDRMGTAEFRGSAGDVVTLAVDGGDVSEYDGDTRYRLVTLPVEPRSDREFASLLRSAEETMGVVTLVSGSPLVDTPVGTVDASVVAIRSADGAVEPIPARSRPLAVGESLYVIARLDELRKLDAAAGGDAGAEADKN